MWGETVSKRNPFLWLWKQFRFYPRWLKIQACAPNAHQNRSYQKMQKFKCYLNHETRSWLKNSANSSKSNKLCEIHFDVKNHDFSKFTFNNNLEALRPSSSSIYPNIIFHISPSQSNHKMSHKRTVVTLLCGPIIYPFFIFQNIKKSQS